MCVFGLICKLSDIASWTVVFVCVVCAHHETTPETNYRHTTTKSRAELRAKLWLLSFISQVSFEYFDKLLPAEAVLMALINLL